MSWGRQLLALLLLSALAFSVLPSGRADVTLTCGSSPYCVFDYDSGTGATGAVTIMADYTLASPVSLTATELFFNLTGKTTGLSSERFQFTVTNSSNTGVIPITIQTGTVKPSYALNLGNYSYSDPEITAYTQLSSQTVTFDFNTLGPGTGVCIYSSTLPLTSVTYDAASWKLTVVTSGTGTITAYNNPGHEFVPQVVKRDGSDATATDWNYITNTRILTLTGGTTWEIYFAQVGQSGIVVWPLTPTISSPTISFLIPAEIRLKVPAGTTYTYEMPYDVTGVTTTQSYRLVVTSFSAGLDWIRFGGETPFELSLGLGENKTMPILFSPPAGTSADEYDAEIVLEVTLDVWVPTPLHTTTQTVTTAKVEVLSASISSVGVPIDFRLILIAALGVSILAIAIRRRQNNRNKW